VLRARLQDGLLARLGHAMRNPVSGMVGAANAGYCDDG
jgi:hypothetical protein